MPEVSIAEVYFIVFMMALVVIISAVSLYLFIKTYKKEMREKERRESELPNKSDGDRRVNE